MAFVRRQLRPESGRCRQLAKRTDARRGPSLRHSVSPDDPKIDVLFGGPRSETQSLCHGPEAMPWSAVAENCRAQKVPTQVRITHEALFISATNSFVLSELCVCLRPATLNCPRSNEHNSAFLTCIRGDVFHAGARRNKDSDTRCGSILVHRATSNSGWRRPAASPLCLVWWGFHHCREVGGQPLFISVN